jgi:hypothetical protein
VFRGQNRDAPAVSRSSEGSAMKADEQAGRTQVPLLFVSKMGRLRTEFSVKLQKFFHLMARITKLD